MRRTWILLSLSALWGCSSDRVDPFKPVPACMGATIVPLMGDRQVVVSSLAIADTGVGFDLDLDGRKDNKLSALGAVANPTIADSFSKKHDIVLPVEFFGYTGQANTTCTKFAFYLGQVVKDADKDGATTTWDVNDDGTAKGDCMDTTADVGPGHAEVPGNRLDDDCDGYADNTTRLSKPTDTQDLDGDGYTLAMGDCDDRNDAANLALAKSRHPGAMDTCGDGIDQNCDGIPDNDPSCDPFAQNDVTVDLQALSFDAMMNPLITFADGKVTKNVLNAGPDLFQLSVPFRAGTNITLELRGARVVMTMVDDGSKTNIMNGMLGGVLEAVSLVQITGIDASGIIKPDQTLLDAVFVGAAAPLLALDRDNQDHYVPDIDVDGDGLEAFWQENKTPDMSAHVDHCRDGDGTVIVSNFDGMGTSCALAKDAKGNYRFVDGLSVALTFTAVPAKIGTVLAK